MSRGLSPQSMPVKTRTPMMMPSKQTAVMTVTASSSSKRQSPASMTCSATSGGDADTNSIDFDDFTSTSSILEFLTQEQECCLEDAEDPEIIFQEVGRLSDNSDTRSVDEILREAELLIQNQPFVGSAVGVAKLQTITEVGSASSKKDNRAHVKPKQSAAAINSGYIKKIENVQISTPKMRADDVVASAVNHCSPSPNAGKARMEYSNSKSSAAATPSREIPSSKKAGSHNNFNAFVDNLPSDSVLSEESTPKDLQTFTATEKHLKHDNDDTDDGSDTMEEISEGFARVQLLVSDEYCRRTGIAAPPDHQQHSKHDCSVARLPTSSEITLMQQLASPQRRPALNFNATQACSLLGVRRNSAARSDSIQTPDSGISSHSQSTQTPRDDTATTAPSAASFGSAPFNASEKPLCYSKSVNTSPKHLITSATSPIESISAITREHALKQDMDLLQEKLKDTEERLQSLRIKHESLSQVHRDMRETNTRLQEESEVLKLDVQHLNECANVLRSELQSSRQDRNEALELQKTLQAELEESRQEKKRVLEQHDKDTKTIQDLQRQCREMERILMRKHPDSVSALIVASKNPGRNSNNEQENINSRKLLEQRIAQLEADAKEQDKKAQQILANVQARFNSVQSKYETHIADLEMQVLSLQEINTKLNEKIESQVRTLDYFVTKKAERYYNNCTQTDPLPNYTLDRRPILQQSAHNSSSSSHNNTDGQHTAATQTAKTSTRDHSTNTIGCVPAKNNRTHSASSSTSSTTNSTPNNSRPNSKQSGLRKPATVPAAATAPKPLSTLSNALSSKLPASRSDSTISLSSHAKEDAHLLAAVRGMRIDLALKDKAMQRLSRELDECKKTIKKLQKDAAKMEKSHNEKAGSAGTARRSDSATSHDLKPPATTENHALKEAQNKIKLLEADYRTLHDKRLQDLKTLQSAHERELTSCHETVRILQQRLAERDEAFSLQKRRKIPVDYYALKAKVTSLERRHSEREERLHLLVEALSKGRLNGALEELLRENNNA